MPKPTVFVRVKDVSTGHEFDIPSTSPLIERGVVKPVKADRYPPASVERRPKFSVTSKTRAPRTATARPRQSVPSDEAPSSTAEKEQNS